MVLVRYEAEIRRYVSEGVSHASISRRLCHLVSSHRGFSKRSVRHFCAERDIHYCSQLSDRELVIRVRSAVILFDIVMVGGLCMASCDLSTCMLARVVSEVHFLGLPLALLK